MRKVVIGRKIERKKEDKIERVKIVGGRINREEKAKDR